jgi:molecular chaperone GrpE
MEGDKHRRSAKKTPPEKVPEGGKDSPQAGPGQEQAPLIAISMEEYDQMTRDLEQARQQARENSEGWQRERADFANYMRRIERDQAQATQAIHGEILKKFLVILDDTDRALKNRPQNGEMEGWVEGVELIYRKLQCILDASGVKPMEESGGSFDPNRHEAITFEESPDHQAGDIIEVVQQGYMLGDRVLRPARVRVAR